MRIFFKMTVAASRTKSKKRQTIESHRENEKQCKIREGQSFKEKMVNSVKNFREVKKNEARTAHLDTRVTHRGQAEKREGGNSITLKSITRLGGGRGGERGFTHSEFYYPVKLSPFQSPNPNL